MTAPPSPPRQVARRLAPWLALACGCGGPGAFALERPDEALGELEVARAAFRAPPRDQRAPTVVAVTAGGGIVAHRVEPGGARPTWEARSPAADPLVAGDWLLVDEGGVVVGRRLADGAVGFREGTDGLLLTGADGVGPRAVAVVSTGTSTSPRSQVWLVGPRGVDRRLRLTQAAGAPAWGGVAWVPWGSHFLSAVAPDTGRELARLRWDRELLSGARAGPGTLWVGHDRTVRLGAPGEPPTAPAEAPRDPVRAAAAALDADLAALELRAGRPFPDGYRVPRAPGGGFDERQWLLWSPGDDADAAVLVTPRAAVALARDGGARWARPFGTDVVAAAATPGGRTVLLLRDGQLRVLDRDGVELARAAIAACADGGCLGATFAGDWDGGELPAASDAPRPPPLVEGLSQVLGAPDEPWSVAGLVAADALRRAASPDATRALVDLCGGSARDTVTGALCCEALARRTTGMEHVVAALGRRADHLAGTRPPPIEALARAAAFAGTDAAVPLLLARLRDPATPSAALPAVARSLGSLAPAAASAPLEDFVRLYHADAPDEQVAEALRCALDALVAIRGPFVEPLLVELREAPFTQAPLRAHATALAEALAADDGSEVAGTEGADPGAP